MASICDAKAFSTVQRLQVAAADGMLSLSSQPSFSSGDSAYTMKARPSADSKWKAREAFSGLSSATCAGRTWLRDETIGEPLAALPPSHASRLSK